MRHEFTMPGFSTIGDFTVETHETECAVEIEPDEMTCLSSWYVARVFMQGFVKRKLVWFEVPKDSDLFNTIKDWALQECKVALADLWNDYCEDVPPSRRPTTDREEHSTMWGRL